MLAKLVGSEKQIAWAEDIRKKMIDITEECIKNTNERRLAKGLSALSENSLSARALESLKKIESAKWFIENRKLIADAGTIFFKDGAFFTACTKYNG